MALNPLSNVTALFNLINSTPAFIPYLSAPPNDWTIGVSYTTPSLGLGVDIGTQGTLDIDASGKIWFPSNGAGNAGAAYFDPVSQSFNGPFNSTGLVHPQQVAIDANGYRVVQRQRDLDRRGIPGFGSDDDAGGFPAEYGEHAL